MLDKQLFLLLSHKLSEPVLGLDAFLTFYSHEKVMYSSLVAERKGGHLGQEPDEDTFSSASFSVPKLLLSCN